MSKIVHTLVAGVAIGFLLGAMGIISLSAFM